MTNPWTHIYDAQLDEYQIIAENQPVCFIDFQLNNPEKTELLNLIKAAPAMLAALKECHEAMAYMSDYTIPLGMPERVKSAIDLAMGAS